MGLYYAETNTIRMYLIFQTDADLNSEAVFIPGFLLCGGIRNLGSVQMKVPNHIKVAKVVIEAVLCHSVDFCN